MRWWYLSERKYCRSSLLQQLAAAAECRRLQPRTGPGCTHKINARSLEAVSAAWLWSTACTNWPTLRLTDRSL